MNYYNEIDPYCCEWLINLMADGLIPTGYVDSRSIADVQPSDLDGFTQCHFFAGIAGWSRALRIAGWPDDRAVWTGSCPCQPFSLAGKQRGFADDRDLWPDWLTLILQCEPPVIMGEQVASAVDWRARMRSDLEGFGWEVADQTIEAASAGACQLRDRLWFVARGAESRSRAGLCQAHEIEHRNGLTGSSGGGSDGLLAVDDIERKADGELQRGGEFGGAGGDQIDPDGALAPRFQSRLEGRESIPGDSRPECAPAERGGLLGLVGPARDGWGEGWTESEFRRRGFTAAVASLPNGYQFIECPDGKFRRLPPPGVRWLGNGIPSRVAKLRAFGNSIYPPLAARCIQAFMQVEDMETSEHEWR